MWSRIFSYRYLLIHKSTPQRKMSVIKGERKMVETPMWWDVSFSWLSSPKVLLPGIKSTLDKQHPLAGQTNFSADVNTSLVCLFLNLTDVMNFSNSAKTPLFLFSDLLSSKSLFWAFRRVPVKKTAKMNQQLRSGKSFSFLLLLVSIVIVIAVREDLNWKKTFSFGHCPNHLNPPPHDPNSGNLVLFFPDVQIQDLKVTWGEGEIY